MDESTETGPSEEKRLSGEALKSRGEQFMERIRSAQAREKDWRDDARDAETVYACQKGGNSSTGKRYDFNILHSNVETIVPAIYNSTAVPDIRPRFVESAGDPPQPPQMQEGQQPDPQQMAQLQAAMAEYQGKQQLNKDARDYAELLERAITVQVDDNRLDTEIEAEARDGFLSGRGLVRLRLDVDELEDGSTSERVGFAAWSWRDFAHGPAKRWEDVPWIAFRHCMAREEVERFADKDLLTAQGPEVALIEDDSSADINVWEIWSKADKKVVFIREDDAVVMKEVDDPLGLSGFFPMPAPVQPITLTGKLMPVCPFSVYKKLADELDLTTQRINKIMKGVKVRGLVAGDAKTLSRLSELDDNEIATETNLEQLIQTGGLDKAVIWWPVEQAIKVLQQLYLSRDQTKQAIYEITGISDIVRGESDARETARAQDIKSQWGSLRIRKMQRLIERQVRDLYSLTAEVIAKHFSDDTLYRMTGIQMTDGMRALRDQPVLASYRIDIESDSTVRSDMTRERQEMGQFLEGTGAYFSTFAPLVSESPQMAEPVAEIYSAFARKFNLGKQAEDALDTLAQIAKGAAKQEKPNPEAQAAQAELQQAQMQMQADQQKLQAEMQIKGQELQIKAQEMQAKQGEARAKIEADRTSQAAALQFEQAKATTEAQLKAQELSLKERELALKDREIQVKEFDAQTKRIQAEKPEPEPGGKKEAA